MRADNTARDRDLCAMFLDEKTTLQAVGDKFGMTRERVRQILKANGINTRYRDALRHKPGLLDYVRQMFISGSTFGEIAAELEYSAPGINTMLTAEANYKEMSQQNRTARFWKSASITADITKCWIWNGYIMPNGYVATSFNGKHKYGHHIAYELFHGKIPSLWILHNCDNPSCVNPHHLREGTPQDNVDDRERRKRSARHNRTHLRWLTPADVIQIRLLLKQGMTQHEVAERIGFTIGTVNRVATGKRRVHSRPARSFSADQVKDIRRRYQTGETSYAIAKDLNANQNSIWQITRGRSYRDPIFFP